MIRTDDYHLPPILRDPSVVTTPKGTKVALMGGEFITFSVAHHLRFTNEDWNWKRFRSIRRLVNLRCEGSWDSIFGGMNYSTILIEDDEDAKKILSVLDGKDGFTYIYKEQTSSKRKKS